MSSLKLTYCIDSPSFKFDMEYTTIYYSSSLGVIAIDYPHSVLGSRYEIDIGDSTTVEKFISEVKRSFSKLDNLKQYSCELTTESDFTHDISEHMKSIPLNVVLRPVTNKIQAEIRMMLVDFGLDTP